MYILFVRWNSTLVGEIEGKKCKSSEKGFDQILMIEENKTQLNVIRRQYD